MRVNVYAEELTSRVELVEKQTKDGVFTGVRFYLYLPVTLPPDRPAGMAQNVRGPFLHHEGDDDSSAVTFWGKQKLRENLLTALALLSQRDGSVRSYRELLALVERDATIAALKVEAGKNSAVQSLQRLVGSMIKANAVHLRTGVGLKDVGWDIVGMHLSDEVQEFEAEALGGNFEAAKAELGDILGIVVHAAIKLGVTLEQIAAAEIAKLPSRFSIPDQSET